MGDEYYCTGIHTYEDSLYSFETTQNYLLGKKLSPSTKISSYLPKFEFSEDVFELVNETVEYKVYSPYSNMSAVIDYIDVLI